MYVQFSPSAETPGLKIPKDVFKMQNNVSNNLENESTNNRKKIGGHKYPKNKTKSPIEY